jgi:hypothetical protein
MRRGATILFINHRHHGAQELIGSLESHTISPSVAPVCPLVRVPETDEEQVGLKPFEHLEGDGCGEGVGAVVIVPGGRSGSVSPVYQSAHRRQVPRKGGGLRVAPAGGPKEGRVRRGRCRVP